MKRFLTKERRWAYGQIILGCLIGGLAYPAFLTPNRIAPGGLTGVATILNHLFGWHIGLVSLILNAPLFLIGYRRVGKIFAFRSLIATILFSVCIDTLPQTAWTDDPLLGAVFGGVILGIGLGLIIRGGATTGGTDMIAKMLHRRIAFLSVGLILFVIDCIVIIAAALLIGGNEALLALICIYVSSKVIDMVIVGLTSNKACFIMTDRHEAVTQRILKEMERGVTQLYGRGGFTGTERPVILSVIGRSELPKLKAMVLEEDEHAFMIVTEAVEALGEGFRALDDKD